jgi:uncharacterized protein YajQ (UPF0234 family)
MPSVDVVSTVDMQALDNAVNNLKREIATRYDFRNVTTEIELNKKTKSIHILSGDEGKVKMITESLGGQCVRYKVDPKCLNAGLIEATSQGHAKREIKIREGIPKELAQKMIKFIKGLNLKVQPVMQDEQIRVTGKQIDDLQTVMQKLRDQDYEVPLQFVNMKR